MSTTTRQTHCKNGHALSPRPDGRQRCRTCDRSRRPDGRHPKETMLTIPNAPLRERFLRERDGGDAAAVRIARHLGWMRPPSGGHPEPHPDSSRVLKALGIQKTSGAYRERIGYEMGAEIGSLLGMDPHEGGY